MQLANREFEQKFILDTNKDDSEPQKNNCSILRPGTDENYVHNNTRVKNVKLTVLF